MFSTPMRPMSALIPTMLRRSLFATRQFSGSAQAVVNIQDYEKHAYNSSTPVVAFFGAKFSTQSQMLKPRFEDMAAKYPNCSFLTVDIDECPRAAYHADVEEVPSVVVMKGDDAFRVKVRTDVPYVYSDLLEKTEKAISEIPKEDVSSMRSWWDHNIRVDNLNIHRVGWPTQ